MPAVTLLSGGVGGARLARGLSAVLGDGLTVVVNVGDDEEIYGLHVSPDLDTVMYTLAGRQGPHGWGVANDTFAVLDHLAALGTDTTFRLGDADLALNLVRTGMLRRGEPLSAVTASLRAALHLVPTILPSTDDPLKTQIQTAVGSWLSFQDYFVTRGHRDDVAAIRFCGASEAAAAPGVLEAIVEAATVIIAPSNPPLSVWPILAVPGIEEAVAGARRVVAVSPLFRGKPLKGPADRVMASLGLPPGNAGVLAAYRGLITDLVVDDADHEDAGLPGARIHVTDTRLTDLDRSTRFARRLLEDL
jgi:LPPG:FO 2-phospho-L-lactate transferase